MQPSHSSGPASVRAINHIQELVPPRHFGSLVQEQVSLPGAPDPMQQARIAALQFGYDVYPLYQGQRFESVEPILEKKWDASPAASELAWAQARSAVQEGWRVLDQILATTTPIKPHGPAPQVPAAPARKPGF